MPDSNLDRGAHERLTLLANAGVLCATGWFVWSLAPTPWWNPHSLWHAVARGALVAFAAWPWSIAIGAILHRFARTADSGTVILRTATVAAWIAPALLLIRDRSPFAGPVALIALVLTTRLLYADWRAIPSDREADPPPANPARRAFASAVAFACALQLAGILELARHREMAAVLATLIAIVLTIYAISVEALDATVRQSTRRSAATLLATVLIAIACMVTTFGGGGNGDDLLATGRGGEAPKSPPDLPDIPVVTGPDVEGSFPGVILWPVVKPATVLIEPRPSFGRAGTGRAVHPFVIPFGGEYWMFRFRLPGPPRNSYFQRGSPVDLSFSTTDRWPLRMEAHQKLAQEIDLACCTRVRLEISHGDRTPGTVSLELLAVRHTPRPVDYSLGEEFVQALPDDHPGPVATSLDYTVPAILSGHPIDEFQVIYRRIHGRPDKSVRIAIERFVLIPAGL